MATAPIQFHLQLDETHKSLYLNDKLLASVSLDVLRFSPDMEQAWLRLCAGAIAVAELQSVEKS
jgi:hypothetical protein